MTALIRVENLVTKINDQILHDGLTFRLIDGEILGIVGGSGSGKSVLLRIVLGLMRPHSGNIYVWDRDHKTPVGQQLLRQRSGVMFQSGALFSSLTVRENLRLPMMSIAHIPMALADELVDVRLNLVGLSKDDAGKFPNELSGGMIKRVALARAIALDPSVLFLDEPTAGLDPIAAEGFDSLLKNLQRNLGLTVMMVTHDLDTLHAVCNRIGVLVDKKMILGDLQHMYHHQHPWIQHYFSGPRGRAVTQEIL